ncbi:MAG TPA: LamG-like jellyroll fold domain-containing protein, partial [Thermoleophilaceae bacterium]
TPPDTTITAGPSGSVSSASASFEFASSESSSTFECRLDGGSWTACVSPRQLSGLADGAHTFEVRATDQAANTDASPASRGWTVSTATESQDLAQGEPATASSVDATGREADKAVDGNAATRWSSSFANDQWWQVDLGAVKQVSRVELDWETAYASSYEILVSTDGATFSQAATASASGPGLRSTSFTARSARYVRVHGLTRATQWGISFFSARVFGPTGGSADTTPPETTITNGPSGTSTTIAPSFGFSSSETGSSFQCRLDGGAWAACSSPRALADLANGSHTFDVRATDQAGNTDGMPASRTWTVSATYDARVLATAGLASFWRLGETSGTAVADSKGTNAGIYTGGPTSVASLIAGNTNPARNFDGVDDYVDLAPAPFGTPTQVSAEAWVRIDQQKATGGYHFLISDAQTDLSDGFTLAVDSAGRPIFSVASSATTRATAQSSVALTPNTIYHIVGTYDGQTARVYVDGVQRGSAAYGGGIGWLAGRDLQLGRQVAATNRAPRYLDGRLDEAAVYSTALSATTIQAHSTAGR